MIVTLTASELLLASGVGARRHAANLIAGRHDRHGAPPDWSVHIEGGCGELAAAKALGCYWPASVDFRERQSGDLPGGVEVRTTSHATGCLLLHPEDADDRRYILVTGRAPTFEVRGWCRGWEGKHQSFWKDPAGGRPAFFVAQKCLRPMSEWSAQQSTEA